MLHQHQPLTSHCCSNHQPLSDLIPLTRDRPSRQRGRPSSHLEPNFLFLQLQLSRFRTTAIPHTHASQPPPGAMDKIPLNYEASEGDTNKQVTSTLPQEVVQCLENARFVCARRPQRACPPTWPSARSHTRLTILAIATSRNLHRQCAPSLPHELYLSSVVAALVGSRHRHDHEPRLTQDDQHCRQPQRLPSRTRL